MKHFDYNIICEDIAHQTFIGEFLKIVSQQTPTLSFSLNEQCYYRWKFSNKSDVLKACHEVAARSVKEFNVNLVFVVADFDDWEIANFTTYHDGLHNAMQEDIKQNCIVLLPVRAIEFWLWHLMWLRENPNLTRNVSIDSESRSDIKKQIYGTKKPHKERCKERVTECMKYYNENWLVSRSPSFNHFLQRFNAVVS